MSDPIAEPEWVEVEDGTYRARIPGGYLYRMTCKGAAASMTFVPDEHVKGDAEEI